MNTQWKAKSITHLEHADKDINAKRAIKCTVIMRKKIKIEQYSCELILIVTDKIKEDTNKILKDANSKIKVDYEIEGIFLFHDIDKYYLLLSTQHLTHNTISHEVYHAVVRITEDRDISDEETQAWLMGYLIGTIYKYLETKKIKIKYA